MQVSGVNAAVGLTALQTRNDISTAVAAKVNQAAQAQGEAANEQLESAAEATQDQGNGKEGGSRLDLFA